MIKKTISAGIISAALVVSLCPGMAIADEITSAEPEDFLPQVAAEQVDTTIKTKGAKFDLKKGKVLATSKFMRGAGNIPFVMRLDNGKVTDSTENKDFKQAELTISFKIKKNLNAAQKKKIMAAWKKTCKSDPAGEILKEKIFANYRFFLVDYVTGENLENPNNTAQVTRQSDWSFSGYAGYRDKLNWWYKTPVKGNLKVTIQYPKTYKNLCFGFGADRWTNYDMSKYDASFNGSTTYKENGKMKKVKPYAATFYQTDFLKKARNNYHFIKLP